MSSTLLWLDCIKKTHKLLVVKECLEECPVECQVDSQEELGDSQDNKDKDLNKDKAHKLMKLTDDLFKFC